MLNYYFTTTQMKNFNKSFFPISRNFVNINNAKNFYQFEFLALFWLILNFILKMIIIFPECSTKRKLI